MPRTIHSIDELDVAPFLKSLRAILEIEDPTIIRWTNDGRAFEIHDVARMLTIILPKYFKHSKYASFHRQLNYFNFRKWTKSRAAICTFSNTYFIRDKPQLALNIRRKKTVHMQMNACVNMIHKKKFKSHAFHRKSAATCVKASFPIDERPLFDQKYRELPVGNTGYLPVDTGFMHPPPRQFAYGVPYTADEDVHYKLCPAKESLYDRGHEGLDWVDMFLPYMETDIAAERIHARNVGYYNHNIA